MIGPARIKRSIETRHNEMAYAHADSTSDEDWLASKHVNIQYGGDSSKEKENATDAACKERSGVTSQAQIFEDKLSRPFSTSAWVKPSKL